MEATDSQEATDSAEAAASSEVAASALVAALAVPVASQASSVVPATAVSLPASAAASLPVLEVGEPDQADWSSNRRTGYATDQQRDDQLPIAVLRIASLDLEVPIFDDTGRRALNRGAGHVATTAPPGDTGNIAIAGHRDGFFRPLEGIPLGTKIELQTLHGTQQFSVAEILIVDPLDVSVLDETDETTLTLITCYPFRYVGHAPDRYIVRAQRL